ncbi:MAG: AAA family ATPase [Chloroflexia bacterium]
MADFFAAGRTAQELRELMAAAPPARWAAIDTEDDQDAEGAPKMPKAQPNIQSAPSAPSASSAKQAPSSAPADTGWVCAANVQAEAVRWLWPSRIPLGMFSIIDGDPGLGKSLLTLDLAARLTTGRAMWRTSSPTWWLPNLSDIDALESTITRRRARLVLGLAGGAIVRRSPRSPKIPISGGWGSSVILGIFGSGQGTTCPRCGTPRSAESLCCFCDGNRLAEL